MIDFSKVTDISIAGRGNVTEIKDSSGRVLWNAIQHYYVSLGDSIAAGHAINSDWGKEPYKPEEGQYAGTDSQYGETLDGQTEPNEETTIVTNSYTDLIRDELASIYGKVSAKSFAHSGDTVTDLIDKIKYNAWQNPLAEDLGIADIVTVCIGANDILGHVDQDVLKDYIELGDPALTKLSDEYVGPSLTALEEGGYKALLDELYQANPKAKYVFTTIYNPYKYLHIDEGANGFFKPLLDWIPSISIGSFNAGDYVKQNLLSTDIVELLFERVNDIGDWVEQHINRLNNIIKNTIDSYPYGKFSYCETKAVFDTFPNRNQGSSNEKKYNDLIHTEFTSGYDTALMDWGALWRDYGYSGSMAEKAAQYWTQLIWSHWSSSSLSLDIVGLATELVYNVVERVIVPNVDPHPTMTGQAVIYEVFETKIFEGKHLDEYTITYNANNGTNASTSKTLYTVGGRKAYTTIDSNSFSSPATGYHSRNYWTTSSSGGTSYAIGSVVGIKENLTLYAQWTDEYKLTLICEPGGGTYTGGSGDTGDQSYDANGQTVYYRACNIDNQQQLPQGKTFGQYQNEPTVIPVKYNTDVGVILRKVSDPIGNVNPAVRVNGSDNQAGWIPPDQIAYGAYGYGFKLTKNTTIRFVWYDWRINGVGQAYWDCYIEY